MDEKPMSFNAYAKSRGLSRTTVRQYAQEGKIVRGIWTNPDTGHQKIWASIADEELKITVDSERYPDAKKNGQQAAKKTTGNSKSKAKTATPTKTPTKAGGKDSLVALKRQHEAIKVQKAALLLRQQKGDLLERKIVDDMLFKFGKLIRDSILAVPDRVAADLFAAESQNELHTILMDSLEMSLRQLSQLENFEFQNE